MKKVITVVLIVVLSISNLMSASYEYIDIGDYYYINNFGDDNDYVVVVRKLKSDKVKVRNIDTGATQVVLASELLTKSQLDTEENVNMAIGIAGVLCILGGCADQ